MKKENKIVDEAQTLTITDNRTGKSIKVPIWNGTIKATDLSKIGLRFVFILKNDSFPLVEHMTQGF